MTLSIHLQSASWPTTPSSAIVNVAEPKTGSASVLLLDDFRQIAAPLRSSQEGYSSIDDLVAEFERDPEMKSLMEDANRELAATFYRDEKPTLNVLRLRKGYSQASLASILNTSQSHIARLEKGRDDPQLSTVLRLAEALDVDVQTISDAFNSTRAANEARRD